MGTSQAGRPGKDREILAAGRALLFGEGPQAVTMEAVARAAGVAKPTLYRRWPNRDELLAAIAEAEAESMAARFALVPSSTEDVRRALIEFAGDLTAFLLGAEHVRFIHALGAAERRRWGAMLKSREHVLRQTTAGMVLCAPNSPLVRGALTALFWLAPPPYPHRVCRSVDEAFTFTAEHQPLLDLSGCRRVHADLLQTDRVRSA